jgi:DNA-binding NarL/FixJ family response regulator
MPTVLIVDDHPSFRRTARALLEAEGFTIVGDAADGHSAIAAALRLHPDLVLLDVQLPDIDGFEVASRIRNGGGGPTIVLTSSREVTEYGSLIAECGAAAFIPKDELCGEKLTAAIA